MKPFQEIDPETGIEDYPGYVGMTWDGEISMIKPLRCFEDLDWWQYSCLLDEMGRKGLITYTFQEKVRELEYEPFSDVAHLVNEMTTIEVQRDDGTSHGGMASGSGYIFFLKDGYSLDEAQKEFVFLVSAVKADLESISNSN